MIVKSGRLFLWRNNISEKELIVKVGTGVSSDEYVEIDQTVLSDEIVDAEVKLAKEQDYEQWVSDNFEQNWSSSIKNIDDYIFEDDRKIIVYVKIKATQAFEFGEIGLFVITRQGWNAGIDVPSVEPAEPENGDMWYDTVSGKLYEYSTDAWDAGIDVPSVEPAEPENGDMWYDTVSGKLYEYDSTITQSTMISRNLLHKQYVSDTEFKIIKYTINI